jgi:hypothetical protein
MSIVVYTKEDMVILSAVEWQSQILFGLLHPHRINGPAVIFDENLARAHFASRPTEPEEYWIDGNYFSEERFKEIVREIESMTDAERLTDPRWWVRDFKKVNGD